MVFFVKLASGTIHQISEMVLQIQLEKYRNLRQVFSEFPTRSLKLDLS